MKKFILPFFALFLLACGGEEATDSSEKTDVLSDSTVTDTVVIEENDMVYIEDYAQYDTKTKLYDTFGKENIRDVEKWYAEGTVKKESSILTDPENGYVIEFSWDDNNEKLEFIEACWQPSYVNDAYDQKIQSRDGMFTGMTLAELVAWNNGEHFDFSGFGWDYAGGVFAKDGSKISKSEVEPTLTLLDEGYETHMALVGDANFNTADKEAKDAPVVVYVLTYYVR